MYQIIKTYCENNAVNGLFLLDMPTGFGKTYSVLKYIFEASQLVENKDRRFFFITPLKKNLPVDDIKNLFEEAGKLTEYHEKVLFIDSTSESVIEKFKDIIEKAIPKEITKTEEYKNFQQEIKFLQRQRSTNDYQLKQMAKGIEKNFRERTEPTFRRMISGMLTRKYKTAKQRLSAIKTENDWKWVGELYPAVFTQDKQIIFMSMDKFLSRNATIVEPSYQFYNNKIIDNAVIFLDEFDSVKETMLKNIIQTGLRDKIDFIELYRSIYAAMETNTFPTILTTPSEQRKNSEYNKQSLEKVIEDTREKAREIYAAYSLKFSHRTTADTEEHYKNFLFQDYQFHSILNGNNSFITSVSNKEECINEIHFTAEKPKLEAQNIHVMLGKLRGFIQWFQGMVNILAINYRQLKNERRKNGDDEFTQEQAIRTVLSLFHLSSYEADYLTMQIMMASRSLKNEQIAGSEFDRTVYEHGFRYYCFENDVMHDMQSQIMMCSFQNTPEKLLIRFCERAKVIGISATATVPTVIGNFDLNYLRNKMQGAFYQMPASEYRRLKQDFISTQSGYRHISIHTQLLGATTYSLQTWEDIFNDKDLAENSYELLENEVYKDDRNSSYNLERYARIAMAFKAFLQHDDIKSMLCLLTKHPAQNDKFLNSEILNKILSPIAGFRPKQKNKYIEYLKGDNFDSKKESILTRLANGEKLFVISTYQTIGAGQNLQYKIPAELQGKLVCSNKFSPREEKDFDAIYLDKPTNLFVNMEPNWWEENFVKYLFQVEFLQENRELSITDTLKHVRKAFRCYAQGNVPKEYVENVYDRQSIRMYSTRAVVQAIGRICRTNQKNPNIYIFADDRIADYLDLTVTEGRILNHEFMALVKKIEGTQKNAPIYGSLENGADLVSNRAGRDIDNILNDSWTEGRIKKWQELRQIVLRFPTVSTEEVKKNFIFSNYYVELPQKSNVLYYTQESDFRKINISFGRTQLIHFAEDESGTRLDRIMRWDSLRNFFQSKGYATSFKPNDYIMSPPIWNNIYKGALGEKVGKFWFAQVLNITLEEINEPEKFELFDFKVPGIPAYVDFKNWDETSEMDWDTAVDKIQKKAVKSGCKCVIIANIITRSQYRIQRFPKDNFEFLIVPSLLRDNESITIDRDAANAIRRFLDDCTN